MKAGDACVALQAPRRLRWQRSRQRVARWSPSCRRGRAKSSTRTNSRAAPATLRLHLDVSILRRAQDRYVAKNAFASATEATESCLAALEEPGAHIKREHLAIPRGMSPEGRRKDGRTDFTASRTATISPTVLGTAMLAFPRLATPDPVDRFRVLYLGTV